MVFILDYLSREILYMIFEYLWANDIFHSLYDLSPYINNVLYNYDNYYVNYNNLYKKSYEHLLINLKSKIKCLILTNDKSIPEFLHIKKFLSDFNLSEFVQVEKLSLMNINEEYFLEILPNIFRFKNLKCLKLDRLPSYTGIRFQRVLTQLTRLDLPDATFFENLSEESLLNLKSLSVGSCTFQQLKHVFNILPKQTFQAFALTDGIISKIKDDHWPLFRRVPQRIKRINLQIDFQSITFINLKSLLSKLPHLISINIKGEGDIDLADGREWEEFLFKTYGNNLINFDFCFTIWSYMDMNIDEVFQSFSRSYWLNRSWYISYNGRGIIYTFPHYASTYCRSDVQLNNRTTINDEKRLFYNCINGLIIHNPTIIPLYRFNKVKFLRISNAAYDLTIEHLSSIVNLSKINHLQISTTIPNQLLNLMTNLNHLSLININSLLSILHKINSNYKFEQIHLLDINFNSTDHCYSDVPPEVLCPLFPNIIKLTMNGISIRRSYIHRTIDGFKKMIYGKYQIDWNKQQKLDAIKDFHTQTCRLISNYDQNNFSFHFESSYLHLFIWDT